MILPGILASGISGHLGGNYTSIATQTVGSGGASSITFSSIPQTYTHLQVRAFYAASTGTLNDTLWQINSDSTSGNYYNLHQIRGDGSSATASAYNAISGGYIAPAPYSSSTTYFSSAIVDILDYTSTNKNKTFRALSGYDANGSGWVFYRSGLYFPSTPTAINSITISPNGGSFTQYTQFALYGVK